MQCQRGIIGEKFSYNLCINMIQVIKTDLSSTSSANPNELMHQRMTITCWRIVFGCPRIDLIGLYTLLYTVVSLSHTSIAVF